ncbi:MAG: transcription antitermination factor NusB [Chloroflexi bacterium]|nr:transcription antitermination factor NusB [Chloroflexota bacterium]
MTEGTGPQNARRPSVRQRRRARMLAFQTLHEVDLSGHQPAEVVQRLNAELGPHPHVYAYALDLVGGVVRHRPEIDALIMRYAPAWPIEQMSTVDRNLLRLGIFETLFNSSRIPVGVAVNEAVELAKRYGSEGSSRLVNGVLGSIVAHERVEPEGESA